MYSQQQSGSVQLLNIRQSVRTSADHTYTGCGVTPWTFHCPAAGLITVQYITAIHDGISSKGYRVCTQLSAATVAAFYSLIIQNSWNNIFLVYAQFAFFWTFSPSGSFVFSFTAKWRKSKLQVLCLANWNCIYRRKNLPTSSPSPHILSMFIPLSPPLSPQRPKTFSKMLPCHLSFFLKGEFLTQRRILQSVN